MAKTMKTRRLGKTNLQVSEIGFGGEWLERHPEEEGIELIRYASSKGINILVEAGIVYKKRGIGMFVAKGAKEVIQKKRKDAFYQDYIASMLAEAQSLGITKQELVQMIMEGK